MPSEARPLDLVPPQAAATICRIDTRYSMPSEARTQDIVAPRRGVRQYVALTLLIKYAPAGCDNMSH